VDIGRSVSRIGGAAQPAPIRRAARNLRILHSRFEELESLARVGLELEAGAERDIARGRLLRALLRQARLAPRGSGEQVLAVLAVNGGWLDGLAPEEAPKLVQGLWLRLRVEAPAIAVSLDRGESPGGRLARPDPRARRGASPGGIGGPGVSRERVLRRHLRTLATLNEVIGALRSLSAQHFRAARTPLTAARAYRDEVQRFLGVLDAPRAPAATAPTGIVLIAADLGLVGDYTARLVREALAQREQHGKGPLVCLGHRALAPLARGGVVPASVQPAPASVAGLTSVLLPLVDAALAGGEGRARLALAGRSPFRGSRALCADACRCCRAGGRRSALPPSPYGDAAHLSTVVVASNASSTRRCSGTRLEHGKRLATAEAARSG
jgi:hypothetical protein